MHASSVRVLHLKNRFRRYQTHLKSHRIMDNWFLSFKPALDLLRFNLGPLSFYAM